jgi:hypothetical protein
MQRILKKNIKFACVVKQWTDPFQKYCIFQVPRVLFLIRIEISSQLRSYKQYSELYASYILFLFFFFAYEGYGERPWTLRPRQPRLVYLADWDSGRSLEFILSSV